MSAPPVKLNFTGRRTRVTVAGVLLLLVGVGATAATCIEYRLLEARRAGLTLKLDALNRQTHRDPAQDMRNAALSEAAGGVVRQLGAAWTGLLAELEGASHDSAADIALLSIEPDAGKHNVRITGESRDLPGVLAYVERLQTVASLRYPTLESHDVRSDDPQHPVRFALSAEWRQLRE